jgi:hypothetical protein
MPGLSRMLDAIDKNRSHGIDHTEAEMSRIVALTYLSLDGVMENAAFSDGIDTRTWRLATTRTFNSGAVVLDYRPSPDESGEHA